MKFITAEQFKAADKKVQDSIIEWWQPEKGDLIKDETSMEGIEVLSLAQIVFGREDIIKKRCTPLLTIQQLIEYIEDVIACKIGIIYNSNCEYEILPTEFWVKQNHKYAFESKQSDLLAALWEVAQKVGEV